MTKAADVLIEVRPGRTRTALLDQDGLVELIVEDDNNASLVGNIYMGRVEKVIASLNAAFIDIGLERSGFLACAEARPVAMKVNPKQTISNFMCEGDKVVVQVLRDPFEDKGPKLTTHLALSGATVVLTPGDPAIRISKRIDDAQKRQRLQTMVQDLATSQDGFVVRTAAQDVPDEALAADITSLRDAWTSLQGTIASAPATTLLRAEADTIMRSVRDTLVAGSARVIIDDTATYLRAKVLIEKQAPDKLERLVLHQGPQPLLAGEQLAEDLDRALAHTVLLPSAGTVIFSETPALVAIDVNVAGTTGGGREQASLKTNLEAVRQIARQIRLRNLSGLLVVDFVSMKSRDNGAKLLEALRAAVAPDPQQVFVGGFTRFGLVEMTRKRGRASLAAMLGRACPVCAGSGSGLSPETIAYSALDQLAQEAHWEPSRGLELICGQTIADALSGPLKGAFEALEKRCGRKVTVTIEHKAMDGSFEIASKRN